METQKQAKTATKEQMRLAELLTQGREVSNQSEDVALQKRVKKVVELTNCTATEAEVALIDEGSVEAAVALLLDKPEELNLWSQQGKARKSKSTTVTAANAPAGGNKMFGSRRGGRVRKDGAAEQQQQQQVGNAKQVSFEQQGGGRPKRALSSRDQNGHADRSKPRDGDRFEHRGRGGGGRRFAGKSNIENEKDHQNDHQAHQQQFTNADNNNDGGETNNGWGSTFTAESTVNQHDEWKQLPRVFMPSTTVNANTTTMTEDVSSSAAPNATTSWPSLDNKAATVQVKQSHQQPAQEKVKTFASVAAMKKAPPPPPPPQPQPQQVKSSQYSMNEPAPSSKTASSNEQQSTTAIEAKNGPIIEQWSSSDWASSVSPPPAEPSPAKHSAELTAASHASMVPETFGASATHSLSVNKEYTDQLKSAIGLGGLIQQQQKQQQQIEENSANTAPSTVDYFQQQYSKSMAAAANDQSELDKKVEFATGDLPPSLVDSPAYQFGFHFNDGPKEGIASTAAMNDPWRNQHISTVELDQSMLKNSTTANVISAMANIPTTSSTTVSALAHFSTTSTQQQTNNVQDSQQQRSGTAGGTGLSFADTASVNFPPANGGSASGGAVMGGSSVPVSTNLPPPSNVNTSSSSAQQQAAAQQQQTQQHQNKQQQQLYTASASQQQPMAQPPQQLQQHPLQQQQPHQTIYHQTSAPAPTAVPQFPNYNMPYMYSPVATAPTLSGANADIDRILMQQYGPYGGLDVQLGAMSLGPPTTLAPSHRNPIDSFMDNKFGPPQQQQSMNQNNTGGLQHNQSAQQQRGPGQPDTNAMFGGGGHVAPPPGFGMPTAPAQPSYMPQPANLQSLFQMPTYHHPWMHQFGHQHQFMMPTTNRMPTSQRPAQTSPPEGNGGGHQQQRRNDGRVNDSQGGGYGGGNDSVEHSTGGVGSQYNKFNTYRPYM